MKLIKTTPAGLLKFNALDAVAGNTLADILEVRHFDVMKTIKKVMKYENKRKSHNDKVRSQIIHIAEENSINFNAMFIEEEYQSRGKTFKTYIMNEDALYLVIANMKGQKAHDIKVWFKSEFNKMKLERSSRIEAKEKSRPMTDQIKILQEKLKEEGSTSSHFVYSTISRQIQKAATGRPTKMGGVNHDTFTTEENRRIKSLRGVVDGIIETMLVFSKPGKKIQKAVKMMLDEVNITSLVLAVKSNPSLLDQMEEKDRIKLIKIVDKYNKSHMSSYTVEIQVNQMIHFEGTLQDAIQAPIQVQDVPKQVSNS